jgi:hypothetical protein
MDWIESWFGVSPDGGDGTVELLIIVLAAAAIFVVALVFNRRLRASCHRLIATTFPRGLRRP